MQSPQKENGHLGIANELAEAFARLQLSGNEWRLLWVILRSTYGWNKKIDNISITQFQQRTGIKRRHISRAMKNLVSRNIVTKNDTNLITSYGLQKDYSRWQLSPKKTHVISGDKTVTKIGDETITKIGAHKRHKDNKDTRPDFFKLKSRYPNQEIIQQVFDVIASTRKSGKVSDSVLLAQLQKWNRYPVEQVESGIRTYLEKDYASEGKKEEYLLGIIRNQKPIESKSAAQPQRPRKQKLTIEELRSND